MKEQLEKSLNGHTIKTRERLIELTEQYLPKEYQVFGCRGGVWIFHSTEAAFKVFLHQVGWKSRRPEGFSTDADVNLEKMWRGGFYHKLKGVNAHSMHRESFDTDDDKIKDESCRMDVYVSKSNSR